MSATIAIARRELGVYFDSMVAYLLILIFIAITGFFTWLGPSDVLKSGQASLSVFFFISQWTLLFFVPSLTMRTIAEEYSAGTIEKLQTMPIKIESIVLGKFLAVMALLSLCLLLTLPYYYSVARLGNIDHAATIAGYLGLILLGAAFSSIGIFSSALTRSSISGFLIGITIGFVFLFALGFLAGSSTAPLARLGWFLAFTSHLDAFSRGVLDTRDLIYMISVTAIFLAVAELTIQRKRR